MSTEVQVLPTVAEVCRRVADGEELGKIAESYGISRGTLFRLVLESDRDMKAYKVAERARMEHVDLECLRTIWDISTFDIGDILNDDGTVKPLSEMGPAARKCIDSIEYGTAEDGSRFCKRIKFADRLKAVDLMGRARGLFKNSDAEVGKSFTKLVEEALKRSQSGAPKPSDHLYAGTRPVFDIPQSPEPSDPEPIPAESLPPEPSGESPT